MFVVTGVGDPGQRSPAVANAAMAGKPSAATVKVAPIRIGGLIHRRNKHMTNILKMIKDAAGMQKNVRKCSPSYGPKRSSFQAAMGS